jgi:hypothetical protein
MAAPREYEVKVTFSASSKHVVLAKDSMAAFFNLLGLFAQPLH